MSSEQDTEPLCDPTAISKSTEPASDADRVIDFGERYQPLEVLGVGGMGEVRLVRDVRLGRDVAAKIIRGRHAGRKEIEDRFVREACLQGQLEHPAIVPVYDLGFTKEGEAFFTMKRVRGLALDQILNLLRQSPKNSDRTWSRRKLLTAFASVCLAIDFAHRRGVLHRDLKPSNIMLGDFGEVYVLDWGIAKILGGRAEQELDSGRTIDGGILGTPGYMSPDQLELASADLTGRADIYALGSILFELLALEPLHPRGTISEVVRSTMEGADARASVRAPMLDVPPELEVICVKATARRPEDRYASAREISDALERFLDGDRDLEARRVASLRHTSAAGDAMTRALSGDPQNEHTDRANALRELSTAIALDGANAQAVTAMVRLVLEPPRSLPVEARAEIEKVRTDAKRMMSKIGGMVSGVIMVAGIPLTLWMGIRDVRWGIVAVAFMLVMTANSLVARNMTAPSPGRRNVIFACGMGLTLVMGQMFGPLIVAPGFCVAMLMPMVINAEERERLPMVAIGLSVLFVPLALELIDYLPRSYTFIGELLCVNPKMASFPGGPTLVMLSYWTLMQVLVTTLFAFMLHKKFTAAEEQMQLNVWYLKQLIPKS